jgi:ADP-heptose:LPS heptosyltransferase
MDVLVLRALGIGDLLVAVPALRGLRKAFPDDRITLAAPGWLRDLVPLTAAVDRLLPTAGLGAMRWHDGRPAVAVNLHGRGPESIADLHATGPARLLAHQHPDFPDLAGPPWHEDTHEVTRWCDLLSWYGVPADPDDLALTRPPVPSAAPDAVVLQPGAMAASRRWPPDRFAVVARVLAEAGHRVVVTGGPHDRVIAETVARQAGLSSEAVLAGRSDLAGLAALVAGASLVISNDTGVGHLATAYGTPSVLLFGPTPPTRWGPPADRPRHVALWAGETSDAFADRPSPGLLRLTPDDVLAAAHPLLMRAITADVDRSGR